MTWKKRILLVLAVLLVLVIGVGTQRLGRMVLMMVDDQRKERVLEGAGGMIERVGRESRRAIEGNPVAGTGGGGEERAAEWMEDGVWAEPEMPERFGGIDVETRALDIEVHGVVSPVHVIRSRSILGDQGTREEQLELLEASVAMVKRSLGGGAVVMDLDTHGVNGAPMIMYSREGLDLTGAVKAIFDEMSGGMVVAREDGVPAGEE